MPTPVDRQSLNKTIEGRYATQRAGGAFDVKKTLESPGTSPKPLTLIDAASLQGQQFQYRNGFLTKVIIGLSQMRDARDPENGSRELSYYIKGFSNKKYHR